MINDSNLFKCTFRVPSARLKDWDYSTPGFYSITVCTRGKLCLFGNVIEIREEPGAAMLLSREGNIIEQCWQSIPEHYPTVSLDQHQTMPNHFHGILFIEEQREKVTLGLIINQFKAACTRELRKIGCHDFAWQPRFHDHVVRNEKDLERIQKYIYMNPVAWIAGEDEQQR